MIATFAIAWIIPALIACWAGWKKGRSPAQTPAAFFTDMGYGVLGVGAVSFTIHMLWLGALMQADGGVQALGSWAWYWTWLTATVWVPVLVIAYILRAMREKRQ